VVENESRNDEMPSEEVEQTTGMETAEVNLDLAPVLLVIARPARESIAG
jgi:hypothetical protein